MLHFFHIVILFNCYLKFYSFHLQEKSLEIETWRRDFKKLYAKWNRKTQKELNTKQKASRKKSENKINCIIKNGKKGDNVKRRP